MITVRSIQLKALDRFLGWWQDEFTFWLRLARDDGTGAALRYFVVEKTRDIVIWFVSHLAYDDIATLLETIQYGIEQHQPPPPDDRRYWHFQACKHLVRAGNQLNYMHDPTGSTPGQFGIDPAPVTADPQLMALLAGLDKSGIESFVIALSELVATFDHVSDDERRDLAAELIRLGYPVPDGLLPPDDISGRVKLAGQEIYEMFTRADDEPPEDDKRGPSKWWAQIWPPTIKRPKLPKFGKN